MRNVMRGFRTVGRDWPFGRYVVSGYQSASELPQALADVQGAGFLDAAKGSDRLSGSFWWACAAIVTDGESAPAPGVPPGADDSAQFAASLEPLLADFLSKDLPLSLPPQEL